MHVIALAAQAVAEAEEGHGNVAAETFIFGVIALVVFAALGLVTFSYRDVANRHAGKAEAYRASHSTEVHTTGSDH